MIIGALAPEDDKVLNRQTAPPAVIIGRMEAERAVVAWVSWGTQGSWPRSDTPHRSQPSAQSTPRAHSPTSRLGSHSPRSSRVLTPPTSLCRRPKQPRGAQSSDSTDSAASSAASPPTTHQHYTLRQTRSLNPTSRCSRAKTTREKQSGSSNWSSESPSTGQTMQSKSSGSRNSPSISSRSSCCLSRTSWSTSAKRMGRRQSTFQGECAHKISRPTLLRSKNHDDVLAAQMQQLREKDNEYDILSTENTTLKHQISSLNARSVGDQ